MNEWPRKKNSIISPTYGNGDDGHNHESFYEIFKRHVDNHTHTHTYTHMRTHKSFTGHIITSPQNSSENRKYWSLLSNFCFLWHQYIYMSFNNRFDFNLFFGLPKRKQKSYFDYIQLD